VISFATRNAEETQALGRRLSQALKPGDVVSLTGPLGSGKTCLIQGLCQGLGVSAKVGSPSFVLVIEYEGKCPVQHIDLYRIQTSAELDGLGLEEACDPSAIALVEWGEKGEKHLIYSCRISLDPEGESGRRIEVRFLNPEREGDLSDSL